MDAEVSGDQGADLQRSERLGHALYGLIIVTATVVAEKEHIDEPSHAIGLLLGIGLVLVLAHTYTGWIAERVVANERLGKLRRRLLIRNNVPVALAVVVPIALFAFSWVGLVGIEAAYAVSIAFNILVLLAIGIYEGRRANMSWLGALFSGAAAGGIGVFVILIEINI